MKVKYIIWIICVCMLASCFEDEGNYSYKDVEEITIKNLEESYTINSYNGEVLSIQPVIETSYSDLEYEWWFWIPDKEDSNTTMQDDVPYEAELISTDKDLAYEINCEVGRYTLLLKVRTKSNGYFSQASTRVDVQTMFTRGFYILKETAEGHAELDLYDRNGELRPDLLKNQSNRVLTGKPRFLSMVQSNGMIDETGKYQIVRTACVTTEDNEVAFYDTNDLQVVHDEKDVVDGGIPEGAQPYMAFSYGMSNFFLWSGGVHLVYIADMMNTSGVFSIASSTTGASTFAAGLDEQNLFYWNEQEQRIDLGNSYNWGPPAQGYDDNGFVTTGMKCLGCGPSRFENKVYWVLEDVDGKRYVYESALPTEGEVVEGAKKGVWRTRTRVEIPSGSKLGQAVEYATDEWDSNTLYFVYDNKIYRYGLTTFTENSNPLSLEGISTGETITYLSYQFSEYSTDQENNFKHLIVGTQQGDTYKLYMYNLVAGEPRELVRTVEGKGKLKMCCYISPLNFYNNDTYASEKVSLPN